MSKVEAFVITNGRETFDYVLDSIQKQSMPLKLTMVRDRKWVDSLRYCAKHVKSEFFIRIDDDMMLHPHAFAFFLKAVPKIKRNVGVYVCRLWEDWSQKPIKGIRMYRSSAVRAVGFHPNKLGKVDKVFRRDLRKIGKKELCNDGIVGIHALANEKDQVHYRDLWRDQNVKVNKAEFAKTFDNLIHKSRRTVQEQYELIKKIPKLDRTHSNGAFCRFVKTL